MLDENIVAVSPSSVYRVLQKANLLNEGSEKKSLKGTGFAQPKQAHEHWHTDISYINIACTFYYFISVLDGYSRYIAHWELRSSMTEQDVEIVLQKALEKYPGVKPRIISDNGPQYIANDFKLFVRQMEMTHVTTSPYYPQSNGKIERFHRTLKENIRPQQLGDIEYAKKHMSTYIQIYNEVRLHSAIGYITPSDKLQGNDQFIFNQRKRKLQDATKNRKQFYVDCS